MSDLLGGCAWACASSAPGELDGPAALAAAELDWVAAEVPGTVAGALRAVGEWAPGVDDEALLDGRDWWFRCSAGAQNHLGPLELELGGLATLADVWVDERHVLRSESMFRRHRLEVPPFAQLVIRCQALTPALTRRHGRPRFKSRLVRHQSQRWYRTTLLGRMPGWSRWAAPVGPWRPVRLHALDDAPALVERQLRVTCDPDGPGAVVHLRARSRRPVTRAILRVGDVTGPLTVNGDELEGSVHLPAVERWWPHSHGSQPLVGAAVELDGSEVPLGRVGFRTVEVDREGGAFTLSINGVPVFCRGACWGPPDAVSLVASPGEVRAAVEQARDGGMNVLRVAGYGTYEDASFWDACDELGVLVWQDCMLAGFDPPQDAAFERAIEGELRQEFEALQGRPALAVACGSSESYQQGAMYGLAADRWTSRLLEETIPKLLADVVPGVPYVPSSPSGSDPPFAPDAGVAHYFGVGAYLRPAVDARLAGVRFAAECLSFATPPEPETVEEHFGGAAAAGHAPSWKATAARDAGTSWDFEDVRDHYVRELFGVDPLAVRYADPERALDLGRAAVCELVTAVQSEWRRPGSRCAGAIVLTWRDLWPGAGWGLLDAVGRPKAPLHALARVWAPTAVLLTDDGLSGLHAHVVHDGPEALTGVLRVRVLDAAGATVEVGERPVRVKPHGGLSVRADALLGGFRDLNRAYRFGRATHDVVAVELRDAAGRLRSEACHLVDGPFRAPRPDVGLVASVAQEGAEWALTVSARTFAQYVALDIPGYRPADSWFHLLPGASRTVALRPATGAGPPQGWIRALNATARVRVAQQAAG